MKIGMVSDSHGNLNNLKKAYSLAVTRYKCDMFIHLGDDFEDPDKAGIGEGLELIKVPGVFHPLYKSRDLEQRMIKEIAGYKIMLSHTCTYHKNDTAWSLEPEKYVAKGLVDFLFYGHTHIPRIHREENGVVLVNPGHLKDQDKKGYPPSLAIAEFGKNEVDIKVITLNEKDILFQKSFIMK